MKKGRLEAFSDGVFAIIITIMVLEIKAPIGADFESLKPLLPIFLTYLGSFIYLGIFWHKHHHLIQAITKVNGSILWANLNFLFWLSLLPFVTDWMDQNHLEQNPVALYGAVLLMASIGYKVLSNLVVKNEGVGSITHHTFGENKREYYFILFYAIGVILAFIQPLFSLIIYFLLALLWIVPDKRIEKNFK